MKPSSAYHDFIKANLTESIEELKTFVAQPSVAAQNWGIQECANLVHAMFEKRDFQVQTFPTKGSPIIYAERAGRSSKTLLFYNHYDVQPPEPFELWQSPPFEPVLRDGKLFGRGISDDKSHITSRLLAIDSILNTQGELPCTIKFIIEGEEEISSIHLHEFVKNHTELLKADACIWEFGGVDHTDTFVLHLGLRGICYVELSVQTASQDVHSGLGGSIFPNAAWRLTWALASLKDSNENILIPGFYENVSQPNRRSIELMKLLPDSSEEYKKRYGITHFLKGAKGGSELHLQEVYEPTCTICGLTSGYQGGGSKTVLPAKASAKIDFRLVPHQHPQEILKKLRTHLDQQGFEDVTITFLGGESPAFTDPDDPFVELVLETAKPVYGNNARVIPMVGGSGPNAVFIENLKLPVVTAGLGYPGSQAHAPNENIRIDLYEKAAQHIVGIINAFGKP